MYFLRRTANIPALLRALADVSENQEFGRYELSSSECHNMLSGNPLVTSIHFSGDLYVPSSQFRKELAAAYERHGGDPAQITAEHGPTIN